MANEKRVRNNNVQGTLSSTMSAAGTTLNSAGLANLEAISSTEHAAIIIDPGRTNGAPEIVWVTAHTGAATSATVSRGKEGTAARAHSSTEDWVHAPTATIDYLPFRPPSARVRRVTPLGIGTGNWEEVTFATEDWDTDTMWSSTAPTKVFAKTAGKYLVSAQGGFASSTVGTDRGVGIRKNSTSGIPEWSAAINHDQLAGTAGNAVTGMVSLTTGQYVQLVLEHNVGSNLNTSTGAFMPTLSMLWVSS